MKDKKLVKILKDAGWKGNKSPQIKEVIDACDNKIKEIIQFADKTWGAYPYKTTQIGSKLMIEGKTPEETVVKFYEAMSKKPKKKLVKKK